MSTYELTSAILAGISLVVSTAVFVLLIKQLRLLSQQVTDARHAIEFSTAQSEAESLRQARQATMDFMAGTISKLQELSGKIPPAGSSRQSAFLHDAMVRDSTSFLAVRDYLNYLEDVCVGTNMRIFDADVVRRSMGGRLRRAWVAYEPWILEERRIVHSRVFVDLEACVREFNRVEPYSGRESVIDRVDANSRSVLDASGDPSSEAVARPPAVRTRAQ